ncbi:MAG: hypothetical protein Q9174_002019 [Haloplaca sp. 1 TL-2023]
MPSRSSSRSGNEIHRLDFDDNRRPPSTTRTEGSDPGGLLRDDESLLSNVVEGVIERDQRKMRRRLVKYLSFFSAIVSCYITSTDTPDV